MSIKGHNSVKNRPKIMHFRNNMDLVYIYAYTKFYQNSSICSENIEEKHIFTQSRAITLLFINEFSPFAIPNHSSPISISMQSLKKICQKLLKLESRNETLTDGWMVSHGMQEKESIIQCNRKIHPSGSLFGNAQQSLLIPNNHPRDRFFYLHPHP